MENATGFRRRRRRLLAFDAGRDVWTAATEWVTRRPSLWAVEGRAECEEDLPSPHPLLWKLLPQEEEGPAVGVGCQAAQHWKEM